MPGRKKFVDRVMHFELTPENQSFVRSAFPQAEFISPAQENGRGLATGPRRPFSTRMVPTGLQEEALRLSDGKKLFAFFEKPGAGKTKILLDRAVKLWCEGEIDGLCVFSYATVHEQWIRDELPAHVDLDIPVKAYAWKSGKKPDLSILKPDPDVFRVLTMNYEAYAASPTAFKFANDFAFTGNIMCALDESHRIKDPESVIGTKLGNNRENWPYRAIASGEPTPLGLQDYYNQFWFLDPAIIGAWTWSGFKAMYCRMGGYNNTQVLGYHNTENLHRLMSPYVHVGEPDIKAKQIFELSRFDLGQEARRAYDQMKDELVVELEGAEDEGVREVARARNVLTKLVRLRELACERVTTPEGEQISLGSNRLELLQTLLDINASQKTIIWSSFIADHVLQAQALGLKAAVFNGQTPKNQRAEIIKEFLDPTSKLQWLLASEAAAGTGLNLQGGCRLNIYYSNNNNAGNYWQSLKRTHRLGTTHDVRYINIIARNTVDVGILNSNRRKRDVADMSFSEFRSILDETEVIEMPEA